MTTITLTNKSRRCLVFVLPHESYCGEAGTCACQRAGARQERRIPSSLTIPAVSSAENVSEAVLRVPDVLAAVQRGELAVSKAPILAGMVRLVRYHRNETLPPPRRSANCLGSRAGHFESSKPLAPALGSRS